MAHNPIPTQPSIEVAIPRSGHPAVRHGGRWIALDATAQEPPTRGRLTQAASLAMAHHSLARIIAG